MPQLLRQQKRRHGDLDGSFLPVKTESLRPYLWMLIGSFSFACMGALAHEVGAYFDWQFVAIARSAFPLVIMAVLALAGGARLVFFRPPILWMRSIAGSISLVGTFFALTRLPVADVFTVTNIFPIWVALLSWPLLGEFPSRQVWLSALCGVVGVALIQQPHLSAGDFTILVALGVSLFTALAMIGLHRLKGLDIRAVVVHFSSVSLCFALGAYFLFDHETPRRAPSGSLPWVELAGVGIAATIGQLFLTKAFTLGDPAKVSVVGLTQIVFALVLDAVFLGNPLAPIKLLGIPLVIAPTAALLLRRRPAAEKVLPPEPLETPAPE
ncbi:MAG: DMT family transporter [Gemmataceae bacterium]|nr:DMT family transporter [Gemmataceae bacterium]